MKSWSPISGCIAACYIWNEFAFYSGILFVGHAGDQLSATGNGNRGREGAVRADVSRQMHNVDVRWVDGLSSRRSAATRRPLFRTSQLHHACGRLWLVDSTMSTWLQVLPRDPLRMRSRYLQSSSSSYSSSSSSSSSNRSCHGPALCVCSWERSVTRPGFLE